MTMTITLESGLTMVATETPIDAGALAGARPPTARTVARLISQPDVEARLGFGRARIRLVGGSGGSASSGTRPDDDWTTRPRRPTPTPSPRPRSTRRVSRSCSPVRTVRSSTRGTRAMRVRGKLTSRVVCRVEMQAHVPGAHLRTVEVSAWDDSSRRRRRGAQRGALGHHVQDRLRRAAARPRACCSSARPSSRRTTSTTTSSSVELRYQPANPIPMPLQEPIRLPAPVQSATPLRRTTDTFFSG